MSGTRCWRTSAAALLISAAISMAQDAPPSGQSGFALPKEDDSFTTSLEDFDRYRDKKQWDAAFRTLSKLSEGPLKGFVTDNDGLMLPSRQRIATALRSLPTDGQAAYRLFYDAKAKQLFDQATAAGADDVPPLRTIADQYFLTTPGAAALDRLGDAEFEAGAFGSAAERWRQLLATYPDPPMPAVRIAAKQATALARLKRWPELAELSRSILAKYPGETVKIAGRQQDVADYLQSLAAAQSTAPTTAPADADTLVGLPAGDEEAWQSAFMDATLTEEFKNVLQQTGWGRFVDSPENTVPASATDGQRVYVNWLGIIFAIDGKTGKMVWRTDKLTSLRGQAMNLIERGFSPANFDLTFAGGKLYALGSTGQQNNVVVNGRVTSDSTLRCLDPATGKVKWSSKAGALAGYTFVGVPVADGASTAYTVAAKSGTSNFELLAIDPEKGGKLWSMTLGTATMALNSFFGQTSLPAPLLRVDGSTLYVLTNNGALLAVDTSTHTVSWGLRTEAPEVIDRENMIVFSDQTAEPKVEPPADIVFNNGVMFLKESKTSTLYALDPSTPKLLWKRPLEKEIGLSAVLDDRIITSGAAVEAINTTSHALLWSTALATQTGQVRPVFGDGHLVVQTARGLFVIDSRTGGILKIIRGADRDSVGGNLMICGDKLVAVSNHAVTAYSLAAN